ncbi:MAG: DNA mismatch repair endonuclease MutL [Candidatus Cybelea sp.]
MATIRELDSLTIGQIAAGEIVERPASVVKELVENAVDAEASRILVNIERGGLDLIEVVDDGLGIAADQLPLAIARHATSKLRAATELESIGTLGFRGEGLASIAAVSELELLSRESDAPIGARVEAAAERIGPVEPAAAPAGTRVRVRALFDRVPVRREYLRSPSSEFNRISSWLSSFALAYPRTAFTLRHDGKDVWVMPASAEPRERLAMVFGAQAAKTLLPLRTDSARMLDGELRGFVSAPGHDRPDRKMQLLFVNGRLVRSAPVAGAWTSGYSTFTMIGRHPYGVLFLDLPPDHVDPNVHPAKADVRLRYASQVFDAARRAIDATLREHARQRFAQQTASAPSGGGFANAGISGTGISLFAGSFDEAGASGSRLAVLAQLHRTFILCSDGEALLLVDQHAAHERIAYESIVDAATKCGANAPLLVPQIVELDPAQSSALDRVLETLHEGGLEIESFGERTYRIVATPGGYSSRAFDLAGFLDDLGEEPKQRDVRERVWASLACHSVTVAGERLEPAEMKVLVERLQECANPMHCPHGRPTMVSLGPDELARMFKRA